MSVDQSAVRCDRDCRLAELTGRALQHPESTSFAQSLVETLALAMQYAVVLLPFLAAQCPASRQRAVAFQRSIALECSAVHFLGAAPPHWAAVLFQYVPALVHPPEVDPSHSAGPVRAAVLADHQSESALVAARR